MGKIKVRTLGDERLENKEKERSKQKNKEKKLVKGAKGGERVVSVGPSEEELSKIVLVNEANQSQTDKPKPDKQPAKRNKPKTRLRSQSYQTVAKIVDRNKKYSLSEALDLLERLKRSHFDETVELHINTVLTGISGSTVLPHGSGKEMKIAIANDELISEVQKGKINFDVLLAEPTMMPKLARVAKFLGPRGLMPNPKNGTLTKDPVKLAASFKKGQINFKTEGKAPLIHLSIGKISFGAKKLSENIEKVIDAIKKEKIQKLVLKSTMSPGIKLKI